MSAPESRFSKEDILLEIEHLEKVYAIYEKPSHRFLQMLFQGRRCFYRPYPVLSDLSLTLRRGECVGIIGRNGCGKSTLLQMIAGTLQPTSGSIRVHGRVAALLELGSGFNPEFSGRDNVILSASLMGLPEAEIQEKFDEIVRFADIGDFIDQPVKTYSSGMMLRLAFSVLTQVHPDLLIIDEALAVGDCFFQAKCYAHLRKMIENGVSLLFVSHSQATVSALCSRVILLDSGRILCDSTPAEAFDLYLKRNSRCAAPAELPAEDDTASCASPSPVVPDGNTPVRSSRFQPPLESRMSERIGDGRVRFRDAFFLCGGREVPRPVFGRENILRVVFEVFEPVPEYEIGCVVGTVEGVQLFSLNSFFNGFRPPPLEKGMAHVDFGFRMDLAPDHAFKVDLGFRIPIQGEYADKVLNGLVFEVEPAAGHMVPLLLECSHKIEVIQS